MSTVLVDTGVWYELFSSRDGNRVRNQEEVKAIERFLQSNTILLPWPVRLFIAILDARHKHQN